MTGTCVVKCIGVMCPTGSSCRAGSCQMDSGTGGTGSDQGGGTGIDPIGTAGGLSLAGTGTGTGTAGSKSSGLKPSSGKDPGCACDVVGRSPAGSAALLLAGLGVAAAGMRRRRRAA